MEDSLKAQLEKIERTSKERAEQSKGPRRDKLFYQRYTIIPSEPIFIASSEDIGTHRVRANHYDALIHFYTEQESLKAQGAPIK